MDFIFFFDFFFFFSRFLNEYASVCQANLCNMAFTTGNLFPSHSWIGVTQVKYAPGIEPMPPRWAVYDLPTELPLSFFGIVNKVFARSFLFNFNLLENNF